MLGRRIYYHRKARGMTQEQLAQGICSISHLSKIENGHETPSQDVLEHLCNRLNISLDQIDTSKSQERFRELLDAWQTALLHRDYPEQDRIVSEAERILPDIHEPDLLNLFHICKVRYLIRMDKFNEATEIIDSLKTIERSLDPNIKYKYHYALGAYLFARENFDQALIEAKMAERISSKLMIKEPEILYLLALISSKLRHITYCIDYANQSLNLYNEQLIFTRALDCEILLGVSHSKLRNIKQSEKHYLNALKVAKTINSRFQIGIIYNNLGILLNNEDAFRAIDYYSQSLEYLNGHPSLYPTVYFNLANAFYTIEDKENFLLNIEHGEEAAQKVDSHEYLLHFKVLRYLANEYSAEEAEVLLRDEIIPYFKDRSLWHYVAEYAEYLAQLYESQHRYKYASQYYRVVIDARKNIPN